MQIVPESDDEEEKLKIIKRKRQERLNKNKSGSPGKSPAKKKAVKKTGDKKTKMKKKEKKKEEKKEKPNLATKGTAGAAAALAGLFDNEASSSDEEDEDEDDEEEEDDAKGGEDAKKAAAPGSPRSDKKPAGKKDGEKITDKFYDEARRRVQERKDLGKSHADTIRLGEGAHWKRRYYSEKFMVTQEDLPDFLIRIRKAYIEGLCWVLKYYYQGCVSWTWFYPHHYCPHFPPPFL